MGVCRAYVSIMAGPAPIYYGSVLSIRQHKGWVYASVNGSVLSLRQHKGWTYASVNGGVLSLRQHKGWT